jgi:hypothetical protein
MERFLAGGGVCLRDDRVAASYVGGRNVLRHLLRSIGAATSWASKSNCHHLANLFKLKERIPIERETLNKVLIRERNLHQGHESPPSG